MKRTNTEQKTAPQFFGFGFVLHKLVEGVKKPTSLRKTAGTFSRP